MNGRVNDSHDSHTNDASSYQTKPSNSKAWSIIGAPMYKGQNYSTGIKEGPDALRKAGLKEVMEACGKDVEDVGDAFHPDEIIKDSGMTDSSKPDEQYYDCIRNCQQVGRSNELLCNKVREEISRERIPLIIGGDHALATGSISGSLSKYNDLAVLWIDAHSDMNSGSSSPTGNYHGMTLGHLTGCFTKKARGFEWFDNLPNLNPQNVCFIGLRDLDRAELANIKKLKMPYFTMHDIEYMGIGKVMDMALKIIDPNGDKPIHVSYDIDSCDPTIAPGTGTAVNGGLTYREADFIANYINKTNRLVSMDMVEVNPKFDKPTLFSGRERVPINGDASMTVRLALNLIATVCGIDFTIHDT